MTESFFFHPTNYVYEMMREREIEGEEEFRLISLNLILTNWVVVWVNGDGNG